jgi:SAM-dependent methyltransferase
MTARVIHGDCRAVLPTLEDSSADSVVCDPPYELGFMGKKWDATGIAYDVTVWRECLRVLKPGGHLLAFGGARTAHRMVCAIEDAGFEIREGVVWLFGSGFPKSHDVSKAIDKLGPPGQAPFADFAEHYEERRKAAGLTHAQVCAHGGWHGEVNHGGSSVNWANGYGMPTPDQWPTLRDLLNLEDRWAERVARVQYEREVIATRGGSKLAVAPGQGNDRGATDLAITAPGSDAAATWAGWGTALKPAHEPVCLARKPLEGTVAANVLAHGTGALNIDACRVPIENGDDAGSWGDGIREGGFADVGADKGSAKPNGKRHAAGRWPANVLHDGSAAVVAVFPSDAGGGFGKRGPNRASGYGFGGALETVGYGDQGSAARFFYSPKADSEDRNDGIACNDHPTVKPTDLMRYLCRLITPPGGLVLDPFCGSGSTGRAAIAEGFRFVGIELDEAYVKIAEARMRVVQPGLSL